MITISKNNFKNNIVDLNTSILDCVRLLQNLSQNIIFVTKEKKLYGSITDNDIRQYYLRLKNIDINKNNISNVVNKKTFFLLKSKIKKYNKVLLKKKIQKFKYIPVLNNKKEIIKIFADDKIGLLKNTNKVCAIIMAGGYGTRLRPITLTTPKPVIVINKSSNLISLMNNLKNSNINKFFITTHYLSKLIKKEVDMFWLDKKNMTKFYYEKKLLGTFGSVVALIKKYNLKHPLIICNSDIVTDLNFSNVIEYFFKNNCQFLVCNKILINQIPYGVIEPSKNKKLIRSFQEKPADHKLINAGIYMVDPKIISKFFKQIKKLSIVDVLDKLLKNKVKCHIFPIDEFWSDMGTHEELEFIKKSGRV